jgi:hypothetical protein
MTISARRAGAIVYVKSAITIALHCCPAAHSDDALEPFPNAP